MKQKYCEIDFEFTDVTEQKLRLVCCSLKTEEYGVEEFWLLNDDKRKQELKDISSWS